MEILIGISARISWAVPGNDPSASPGEPHRRTDCLSLGPRRQYRQHRRERRAGRLLLGDPALQVTRSNATLVGSAFADVSGRRNAGCALSGSLDPIIVNTGHECLVEVQPCRDPPKPPAGRISIHSPTLKWRKESDGVRGQYARRDTEHTVSGLQRADKSVIADNCIGR